ncbi:alpha/beta hydrolase [Asanoa sp. NPDC049518]|uniref:alpha/beta hydrolase n=1 Tax=unclassified Asanoa TaxID=2685164 RepID=UPI00341AD41B
MKLSFRRRLVYAGAAVGALSLGVAGIGTAQAATSHVAHSHHSRPAAARPTVVLVHGAWADGSSWDKVTAKLQHDNYRVVVPPNPLTGVTKDAESQRAYLATITGPIVLVGHSYGGMVITNAALGNKQVKALVYVDAYIPDKDDTVRSLTSATPGSVFAADPTTLFDFVGIPAGLECAGRGVRRAGLADHSLVVGGGQAGRRHPRRAAAHDVRAGQGTHRRDQRSPRVHGHRPGRGHRSDRGRCQRDRLTPTGPAVASLTAMPRPALFVPGSGLPKLSEMFRNCRLKRLQLSGNLKTSMDVNGHMKRPLDR